MAKTTRVAGILMVVAVSFVARPEVAAREGLAESETAVVYRHAEPALDSAMRFLAETVTEDSHRIEKPTYRVDVSDFCTLRFEQLDAGRDRVAVHVVDLSRLDPRECSRFERKICLETTSLENTIAYYELPRELAWTYGYGAEAIPDSRAAKDRFCFFVSRSTAHRVSRALHFALAACDSQTGW